MEGVWRRGTSLLKGFRELDPVLCLCPPLFFFKYMPRLYEPRHFLKASRSRSSNNWQMMKTPLLECNATKDRGTKVCSTRRVRKSSKRLKIVEQLRRRRACGFCLCLLLGYCTWYYGVFFTIHSEHNITFLSSVVFMFIVFLMLKQVASCCEGMCHNWSPSCCWWL